MPIHPVFTWIRPLFTCGDRPEWSAEALSNPVLTTEVERKSRFHDNLGQLRLPNGDGVRYVW